MFVANNTIANTWVVR